MKEIIIPGRIMKMYREAGMDEDVARETEKKVYDHFPVTKAERKCATEKATMDQLRMSKRKRLIEQEKKVYDSPTPLQGA